MTNNFSSIMQTQNYFTIPPPHTRPIYMIGAGGIVNDAHLPAYAIAKFKVDGIFDIDKQKAKQTAKKFNIPHVFESLEAMLQHAPDKIVFDVAVPGDAIVSTLSQLPVKSAVLVQKPMGNNYNQAKQILALTRSKEMIAGVNFQLRYAPFISVARKMIQDGKLGEVCDIEINVNVYTPWHLWDFLFKLSRVEILYHSIHYIDLVRSFLGNPISMYAKTARHPTMKQLASVRSSIIMDYGDMVRVNILTNHAHQFGLHHQHSYIKFEGTKGAIKINLGLLMDYPKGVPDKFEYVILEEHIKPTWNTLNIEGGWFPEAFIGSMLQIQLAAEGRIVRPDNSVEDCINTMACVEAAYDSSEVGGMKLSNYLITKGI